MTNLDYQNKVLTRSNLTDATSKSFQPDRILQRKNWSLDMIILPGYSVKGHLHPERQNIEELYKYNNVHPAGCYRRIKPISAAVV